MTDDRCGVGLVGAGAMGPSAWDGHVADVVGQACVESLHSAGRVRVDSADRPALYAAAASAADAPGWGAP